jgi:hypothetical protein
MTMRHSRKHSVLSTAIFRSSKLLVRCIRRRVFGVLISITDRRATDGAERKLPEGIAVLSSAEHTYLGSAEVRVSACCIRRTGSSIAINSETVTNL